MTTRSGSMTRLRCIGLLLLVPGLALAGPNEGGTLILHANPGLVFTSDVQNYCGMAALDSCSAAVTSVPWEPGTRRVFHVLAAFPTGSSPRLKSLSFGIDYDPAKLVMVARGSCADFELPDGTWPAAGTGTAQSWTTGAQTGLLTEVYWCCGYTYSEGEDSTSVALIPHPLQHGVFVDDAFPAEVDTIAGYGRLGFGTAGYLPCATTGACCQPDGSCEVVPWPECEAANGAYLGGPCNPSPCPVQGEYVWDTNQMGQGWEVDEPLTVGGYTFYSVQGSPNEFYVEPGADGTVSLGLRLVNSPQNRAMWVRMIDPETNTVIWEQSFYLSNAWTELPDLSWPRHRGMARVQIARSEDAPPLLYAVKALDKGSIDRLHINSSQLGLYFDDTYVLPFYVPLHVSSVRLRILPQASPPAQAPWYLYDRSSTLVASGSTGTVYQLDNLAEPVRGGIWRLYINSNGYQDPPHGVLEVAFRSDGAQADDWWVPDHAFALTSTQPVRSQFGPHEIVPLTTGDCLWSPQPSAQVDSSWTYTTTGSASRLYLSGQQRVDLVTRRGDARANASIRIRTLSDSLTYTIWSDGDWGAQSEIGIPPGGEANPTLVADPYLERIHHLRIVTGGAYEISTTAPGAVITTIPGPSWTKPQTTTESDAILDWSFFVPNGVSNVELSLSAERECGGDECAGKPYRYLVFPEVELTVMRPDGLLRTVKANSSNRGDTLVTVPSDAYSGRLWKFSVAVPGAGLGRSSGLRISVALGDSLPKYVSWSGEERFRIPVAVPSGDLSGLVEPLGHRDAKWRVVLPAPPYVSLARLFGSSTLADTTKRYSPIPNTLSRRVLLSSNPDSGFATMDLQRMELRAWSPPAGSVGSAMMSRPSPFYALQRPVGLDPDGRLRSSDGGLPGSPTQCLSLDGPTEWIAGDGTPPPAWMEPELDEGIAKDFKTFAVHQAAASYLHDHGCHLLTGNRGLAGPVPTAFAWSYFAARVGASANLPGALTLGFTGEPLSHGFAPEDLRRAIYMIRKKDNRHPIVLGDEPDLAYKYQIRDMTEIWEDEEYFERGATAGGDHPICGQIDQIMKARASAYPDRAISMHQLAGFPEAESPDDPYAYHGASPDEAGAQMLASICLGVDLIGQFCRFFNEDGRTWDMATWNAALWGAYGPNSMIATVQKVIDWRNRLSAYNYDYSEKLAGDPHGECEYGPVAIEYGEWRDSVAVGRAGRWFALAHLGQVAAESIERSWAQLELPASTSMDLIVEGSSGSFATGGSVSLDNVTSVVRWNLPPVSWVVGRIAWDCDPASATDRQAVPGQLGIKVTPNPTQGYVQIRLLGNPPAAVDLDVFAVGGMRIRRLGRLGEGAGPRQISWDLQTDDGLRVSSGVYYIRALGPGGKPVCNRLLVVR